MRSEEKRDRCALYLCFGSMILPRFHNSGPRCGATTVVLAVGALVFISSLLTPHSSLSFAGNDEGLPEIRRVLLRPEQLPAEMERVRRGVLRALPLTEFDGLLARAADAAAALREPPRLLQASYRATLTGESLTGSATWSILHGRATTGLLSLEPLNLGLRSATWDDGSPAVIGDLDARPAASGLELLVGRPGEQRLSLEWSARGVQEPAGLRFDLRVPACQVAVLDLDLPADREPNISHDDGLLTGPLPGSSADRRLWRLAFAGASRLDLIVRRVPDGRPPLLLVQQRTRQDVSPGQTECEFQFDLEVPKGGARDLILECDPVLRPTEVVARNLERWEVQAGTDEDELTHVAVHFREPMPSGSVTLRAVGPATPDRPWASPAAAIIGAVQRGESLTLRIHPDLRLSDWRAGPFRLIDSAVTPDRWQVLSLHTGLIRPGPGRPAAWLRPAGPDFQVRERLWWSAAADRMTLTAQIAIEVSRGPVFQIPLQLPPGWEVERVESDPPDLLAAVTPDGQRLRIDLQKALGTGAAARFTVELRCRPPRMDMSSDPIPLPDVVPIGARGREGTLAIRVGPGLQSAVSAAPPADAKLSGEPALPPWGDAPADYVFPLRLTPAIGGLRIWRRIADVSAHAVTTVTVGPVQAELVCRLRLEPAIGSADGINLHLPGANGPWDWEVVQGGNRVRSVQRLDVPSPFALAALAARTPWAALAAAGVPATAPAEWWRITFARPLSEPIEIEAHAVVPRAEQVGTWKVPLVRVPSASVENHEVTLDLRSFPGWRASPVGLTELPLAGGSFEYRAFRYGAGQAALALAPDDGEAATIVDPARLVTYATDPTRLVHRLNVRLWSWDRPTIPIDLPLDAVLRQVRVNGIEASPAATTQITAFHIEVPASAGTQSLAVEVVYTTGGVIRGLFTRFDSPAPGLPLGAVVRRIWCLPAEAVPLSTENWREVPATNNGDSVGLLPADLARGTFWESKDAGISSVRVVRPRAMGLIGGLAAAGGLALAWASRSKSARRRWTGLLAWACLAGAAVIWLPAPLAAAAFWPLLAGVLVVAWQLLPRRRRTDSPTVVAPPSSSAARVLTAGLLVAIGAGSAGRSAAPAPVTVYLVPSSSGSESVLAPPDLLDRLTAQTRRGPGGLNGAAWIDARYEGRVAGGEARFTVVLRLHSFADQPSPLALPLSGVQLGDAKLDGAPAFLRATGDHYLVPVHGRGPHTLEVAFSVPCAATGDDREMRFGVPEIANSRLTFDAPVGANLLRAIYWRGAQNLETDAGRPRLDVDLGQVGTVHVRWRVGETAAPPATIQAQETYLWDLAGSAARLLGAVRYTISPGSATVLTLGVPNSLKVVAVAARPLDAQPGGGWLRSWRLGPLAGGQRPLILEFAAPIDGRWQVNLELVPRGVFAASFALPFPSAAGIRSSPAVFAWRRSEMDSSDSDVTDVPPDAAAPVPPEVFLRDHWLAAKIEADPRPPTRAYQRNAAGPIPSIRLKATAGSREQATADIHWRIGLQQAEFDATAHVTDPTGPVSLVEWIVPAAVAVTEVNGPDIYSWSRTGPRLQIWLTRPVAEAVIGIAGSVKRPNDAGRFDVPSIRPVGLQSGTMRIASLDEVTAAAIAKTGLTDGDPDDSGAQHYTIDGPKPYRLALSVGRIPQTFALPRAQATRPAQRTPSQVRIEMADIEVARSDGGRWVSRASIWLAQIGDADLQAAWPTPVRLFAVELDGRTVPAPAEPTAAVAVPSTPGGHRLQLVWTSAGADLPPTRPEAPVLSANGKPVPPGPMLWTVRAERTLEPDTAPLPAGAAALYRAAAQLRLAGLGTADAAKIARTRAAIELSRADAAIADGGQLPAGPGGITLAAWRQQLREALRPGDAAMGGSELAEELPFDDAFARGSALSWYIPAGDDGPRLAWPEPRSDAALRLFRTAAILLAAALGLWWGRRWGSSAWPEQMLLLGGAAWAADGGVLWLLPAAVGVAARVTIITGATLQRWLPGDAKAAA